MPATGGQDFAGNLICSLDCPDYSLRAGGYPDAGQPCSSFSATIRSTSAGASCGAAQHLIEIEPQVFDLLVYLVRNRDRVVSKDDLIAAVWGGRIVSESTLSSRITAVRKAIGDSGEQQALIRTAARKGIRFVGDVSEQASPGASSPVPSPAVAAPPRQQVHFCTASDGVRIAYAEVGQGPPLLKTANWLNHLEYDWESPVYGPLLHAIAADHRLIRYDARGNGLSDWDVKDISFEAFVNDLETVVEAVGLKRFSLLGLSQGCAISIAYAVRHPERVEPPRPVRLVRARAEKAGRSRKPPGPTRWSR